MMIDSLYKMKSKVLSWWVTQEAVDLMKLFVPILFSSVLQQLPLFISLLFVGWISSSDGSSLNLDSAALGTSVSERYTLTGSAIIFGASTASNTLSSQSYGYGNYKRVGVILQRGLLIILLVSCFIASLWLNTESIMLLLQQQPCVAKFTSVYVRISILALPFTALNTLLQQYLQPQNIVWPFILVGIITNVINAVAHAVLIFGLRLGIGGAAGALVIALISQPVVLLIYVKIRRLHKKTWGGWSWDSLKEWPAFLKLALPGMVMLVAEWASFEISLLVLGAVNETEQAVAGVLLSYLSFLFMIPYSLSVAISIRIGNELGAGNVRRAKRVVYVTVVIICIDLIAVLSLTIGLKDYLGPLFNADDRVQHQLKRMFYITCLVLVGDQLQVTFSGILRGAGHQFRIAVINVVAYYVLGLPIGIALVMAKDMGAMGMYIGLAIGDNFQALALFVMVGLIKWNKEAAKAMKQSEGGVAGDDATELDQSSPRDEGTTMTTTVELREYSILNTVADEDSGRDDETSDMLDSNGVTLITAMTDTNCNDRYITDTAGKEFDNDSTRTMTKQSDKVNEDDDNGSIGSHTDEEGLINNNNADAAELITDPCRTSVPSLYSKVTGLLCCGVLPSIKLRQVYCHIVVGIIAVICLVTSGITSFTVHVPDELINGNYSECMNTNDTYDL